MIETIKNLLIRYKAVILYLFFGACTTLVNVFAYWVCAYPLGISTMPSTIVAWVIAVLFAYITNRKWVFESGVTTKSGIFGEIVSFFGCRIGTGIIDWLCMFIFVSLLGWNDVIIKFLANVLVIILNFLASKFIVFKQSSSTEKAKK